MSVQWNENSFHRKRLRKTKNLFKFHLQAEVVSNREQLSKCSLSTEAIMNKQKLYHQKLFFKPKAAWQIEGNF